MNIYLILTALGTYVFGYVNGYTQKLWQLIFLTIKIPRPKIAKIYYTINQNKSFKFSFLDCFPSRKIGFIPEIESSFLFCKGMPIWVDIYEKYLTAGWTAKEEIMSISVFRFQKEKLYSLFEEAENVRLSDREQIDVYISQHSYFRKLNQLNKKNHNNGLYLEKSIENQLDDVISDFEDGGRSKSGVLLYGPPGNGKTSIIKYVACKYDYNIYIPIIRPDMTNDMIINLFGDIPQDEKAIILLEDFDNLFDGRNTVMKDAKFSFDAFLNILDGIYLNLDKKIVFITANNIDKIDNAIKNRPSRLDYIIKLNNPSLKCRMNILLNKKKLRGTCISGKNIYKIAKLTDGQSAAIVSEIGNRNIKLEEVDKEVNKIISSFAENL